MIFSSLAAPSTGTCNHRLHIFNRDESSRCFSVYSVQCVHATKKQNTDVVFTVGYQIISAVIHYHHSCMHRWSTRCFSGLKPPLLLVNILLAATLLFTFSVIIATRIPTFISAKIRFVNSESLLSTMGCAYASLVSWCGSHLPHCATQIKKKIKFSSYLRKFRRERLQSHIWGRASEYMRKCANI